MGANASTAAGGAGGPAKDLDHYEVLGIEVTATADGIKKAFRKIALREHPDKNPNDIEGATKRFARIQEAYETLSDPQERAWYDDHREDINNAQAGAGASEAEASFFDNIRRGKAKPAARATPGRGIQTPHLMKFFSTSAWSGFDDSATGFFNTFATLFSLLAADETSWSSPHLYPGFGTRTMSDPADVRAFYAAWTNFSTEKDFAWKDVYRADDDMPRWQRREIDKENTRARNAGKKEYNEAVRNLVLFVRRRDPRYTSTTSSSARAAADAETRAALAAASRQRAAEREAAAARYEAQEWETRGGGVESVLKMWDERSDGDEEIASGEEDEDEVVWCEACERGYRSGGAWENHERSRKHVKNVERLIREMQLEDAELGLDTTAAAPSAHDAAQLADSLADFSVTTPASDEGDDGEEGEQQQQSKADKKARRKQQKKKARMGIPGLDDDDEDDEEPVTTPASGATTPAFDKGGEFDTPTTARRGKKQKKARRGAPVALDAEEADGDDPAAELAPPVGAVLDSSDEDWRSAPRGGRGAKKKGGRRGAGAAASGTATPAPAPAEDPAKAPEPAAGQDPPPEGAGEEEQELSKKDKRRAKEAAKKAAAAKGVDEMKCNVCGDSFVSRTKLFQHISDTGHALADPGAGGGSRSGGGKKKGKR
ncbi:hypothetical protein Rhopal_007245-T1 [Rhodotorula paludigena]|uniref:J domain-containing protein n=1 Tax=Rhodotorula paludigena TaxID=86838 RepID=A0AAV5GNL2_9BASI|nr:hypothetical protein Rhopal_007245-T1 [Rhodotorula paludigena]